MFRCGDRVKMNFKMNGANEGTVIGMDNLFIKGTYQYCIQFDKFMHGHDGNSVTDCVTHKLVRGKEGHCWWVEGKNLILISKYNKNKRIG